MYSTFPLNPTRLPVTSDTARQKLSFTAHGQHRGQETKYNGPTHPHFFPSEQQILNSKMTRQSSLKRLPEKQKLSKAADLKEKKQCVCARVRVRIPLTVSHKEATASTRSSGALLQAAIQACPPRGRRGGPARTALVHVGGAAPLPLARAHLTPAAPNAQPGKGREF